MNKQIGIRFEKKPRKGYDNNPLKGFEYSLIVTKNDSHVTFDRLHEELSKRPRLLGRKLGFIWVTEDSEKKRITLNQLFPFNKQLTLARKGLFPKIMIGFCRQMQKEGNKTILFDTTEMLPDGRRFFFKGLNLTPFSEVSIQHAIELLEKKDFENKPKPSMRQKLGELPIFKNIKKYFTRKQSKT